MEQTNDNMLLHRLLLQQTHATALVNFLISSYFSNLSSTLIIYDSAANSDLQDEYLRAVQQTVKNQSQHGNIIGLQWLNVATLTDTQLEEQLLRAVDIVTEGFITILSNTSYFLHARYYATRNAELRLKDKFYLFLCEDENPQDFLQLEILQFYPHHLMVTPTQTSMNVTEEEQLETTTQATTNTNGLQQDQDQNQYQHQYNEYNNKQDNIRNNEFAMDELLEEENVLQVVKSSFAGAPPPRTQRQDINFELWTQKFVGVAGNLDAVHLDSFEPSETFANKNVELYPNKLLNLKGRALRGGSITYIPYVVTNYVAPGAGNVDPINTNGPNRSVFYDGSEANLLMTFCKVHNCHLRMEAYGVDNWGIIYENESSWGMMGDIFEQRVEVAIGCIYNWYNNITETSHVIARSAVTLLGPAPAAFPTWRTNIMPFTAHLWLGLIVTMFVCSLILQFIKWSVFTLKNRLTGRIRQFRHYKSFEQALLEIFAIFIQQPSMDSSLRSFAGRLFLSTLLIATITLENTYSGQLKSILTIPFYGERVDTMQKWSRTGWRWGAPSIVWVQTVEKSDLLMEQILTEKFEIRDYEYLYNASFRPDYGLGIERLMSGAFTFGDFITAPALETKIIPKDDLYFDWTRAVSIRGWPLMPHFNRHVRACTETGLFVHWEREMVAHYINRQTQQIMLSLASGYTAKSPPQKLTLSNVSGAMFGLLIGYLIAFVALLLELFGHVIRQKFWNLERQLMQRLHVE